MTGVCAHRVKISKADLSNLLSGRREATWIITGFTETYPGGREIYSTFSSPGPLMSLIWGTLIT